LKNNKVVVKTGKIKKDHYLPLDIINLLQADKFQAITDEELFKRISEVKKVAEKGDECNCILDDGELYWCNEEGDTLEFASTDSCYYDIEVNENTYEEWKKQRCVNILSTLTESEQEALNEWFVGLANED
jgi:hypothetical protein